MQQHDDKKFFGLFKVIEDKAEDSFDIKVSPVSYIPDLKGELNKNKEQVVGIVDMENQHSSTSTTKSNFITATWLPEGEQNRISAPDVVVGDVVEIYSVRGTDEYYWTVFAHNTSLRKREKVLIWLSNKGAAKSGSEADAYYLLWDTRNKIVHFHTSDNDGEACTYDVLFNTLNGLFSLKDNLQNEFKLDSVKGKLESTILNEYNVYTKKVNFYCEDFNVGASKSITMKSPTILEEASESITMKSPSIVDESSNRVVSAGAFNLKVTNSSVINGGGTLDMSGGHIKHNGVPIDSTHRHKENNDTITDTPS